MFLCRLLLDTIKYIIETGIFLVVLAVKYSFLLLASGVKRSYHGFMNLLLALIGYPSGTRVVLEELTVKIRSYQRQVWI